MDLNQQETTQRGSLLPFIVPHTLTADRKHARRVPPPVFPPPPESTAPPPYAEPSQPESFPPSEIASVSIVPPTTRTSQEHLQG